MSFPRHNMPDDVALNHLARQVVELLARYTSFPWPVLQAQCRHLGVDPCWLTRSELEVLVDPLTDAVSRWSRGEEQRIGVRHDLLKLVDAVKSTPPARPDSVNASGR